MELVIGRVYSLGKATYKRNIGRQVVLLRLEQHDDRISATIRASGGYILENAMPDGSATTNAMYLRHAQPEQQRCCCRCCTE